MLRPGSPVRRAFLRWVATRLGRITGFTPPPHFNFRESLQCIFGLAETDVLRAIRRHCPRGGLAIDIGANVGYVTRRLCRAVGPEGHVDAFEPTPEILPILRGNTAAFGNVTIHPVAVARTCGELDFHRDLQTHPNSSLYATREGQETIRVPAVCLDAWLQASAAPDAGFIKIDVEGAEIDVMEGARATISRIPDLTVVIEYCPANLLAAGHTPGDFFDCIASLNMRPTLLSGSGETDIVGGRPESVGLNRQGYRNLLLRRVRTKAPSPR